MDASRHRIMLAVLVVFTALSIGACAPVSVAPSFGSPVAPSSEPAAGASLSPAASPSPAFPVTLTDDDGNSVTIPSEPKRIVSLQPATTEILFAVGAGDRVVGKVEDIFPYPPEADGLPVVATYQGVDVEKVVGLEADLVIAGGNEGNPTEDIARLRSFDIPVLVVYPETVDEVLANIGLIGAAVGQDVEAEELVADLRLEIDAITAATADLPRGRVFYEIDATADIYGPADDSFLAEMIGRAGGTPITSGTTEFIPIPLEVLVTADPEIIVLGDAAYGVTPEIVAARPGWAVMTAVKDGAIRPADDVVITRPGPRIALGLADLAKAIHPDIALPTD
ncbi:MAG TPA: ABC transporter substrate-binding protein [Candidatus Limnocylindrales bacterium]|nr:ABC transporter substrate-binding protein [Candidatus Limnocylindrales bacterium]